MLTNDAKSAEAAADVYDQWRRQAPVHRAATPDGGPVWVVTRYADVRALLADPRLALDKTHSRSGYTGFALPAALDANLLNLDPPDHTRIRRLVTQVFTVRRVEQFRPAIQGHVDRLLAEIDPRQPTDLVKALAAPLPLAMIGDILGVDQLDRMRAWTNSLFLPGAHQPHTPRQAITEMEGYLRGLVADRRGNPDSGLISALNAAGDDGDRLTDDELTSLVFLLIWAGYETTIDAIGTCVLTLLQRPDLLSRLHHHPEHGPAAIEEMLRLTGPNPLAIRRFATEELTVGGTTIAAGDTIMLLLASANRDPETFAGPSAAQIDRTPNPHLAFGHGIHRCLGAPLARLELGIAVGALAARFPDMALAVPEGQLRWRPSFRARGLAELPVLLDPVAAF